MDNATHLFTFQFLLRIPQGGSQSWEDEQREEPFNSFSGFHIFPGLKKVVEDVELSIPSPDSTGKASILIELCTLFIFQFLLRIPHTSV